MAGALQPRNGSLQKPRNTSRTLSMLGQYMLHSAPLLILALVLSIVGNVFQLIGPALCGRAIDAASRGKGQVDFQTVYYYALQMIVFMWHLPHWHTWYHRSCCGSASVRYG